jgi:hypothetical protein
MSYNVFPAPSGATTSSYAIGGVLGGTTTVSIPSGVYSVNSNSAEGILTLGETAVSGGAVYLSSTATSATVVDLNKAINWTTVSLVPAGFASASSSANTLEYANGLFWAAHQSSAAFAASADGITWSNRNNADGTGVTGVTYGNNIYVASHAVGSGRISTSTNGLAWTSRTIPNLGTATVVSVRFGNGIFVAATTPGETFSTSTDGTTWTSRTGVGNVTVHSLSYEQGTFFVGMDNGVVRTSTDAITWTTRNTTTASGVRGVVFGNNVYLAYSQSATTNTRLSSSTDGITWTTRDPNISSSSINRISFSDNVFVLAGTSAFLRTSTNGINWTTRTTPFANTSDSIANTAANAGTYIISVGGTSGANRLAYSIGRKNWVLTKSDSDTII